MNKKDWALFVFMLTGVAVCLACLIVSMQTKGLQASSVQTGSFLGAVFLLVLTVKKLCEK